MKLFLLSFFLLSFALHAQELAELTAAMAQHTRGVAMAQAEHLDRFASYKKWYVGEVERLEKLAQAKGDLDGVLALRGERERMDRPLTSAEMKALPDAGRASRIRFDQSVAKSAAQERTEIAAIEKTYATVLEGLQARLTRAGRIESALKVKEALQAISSGAKPMPAPPIVAALSPASVAPVSSSATGGVHADAVLVASSIKGRGRVSDPAPGVIAFDAPRGDGRVGAKGVLLKNDVATGRNGTTWAFDYSRGGTDWGIQIIHPHGRGQFIVHINHKGVGVSTPEHWSKHGYGMGESKRAKLTRAADKVFPLEEGAEYQVLSRVSPTGAWELVINGQVVASARATFSPCR